MFISGRYTELGGKNEGKKNRKSVDRLKFRKKINDNCEREKRKKSANISRINGKMLYKRRIREKKVKRGSENVW